MAPRNSTLLRPPADLQFWRDKLFNVQGEVTLTREKFDEIWPWIEHIWVRRNGKRRRAFDQYNCRLFRGPSKKNASSNSSRKPSHRIPKCYAKIRVQMVEDAVIIRQGVDLDKNLHHHNHEIDLNDYFKVPTAIRATAQKEMEEGYEARDVKDNLKGVHKPANRNVLIDSGGRWLSRHTVYNAGRAYRKANPDLRFKSYDYGLGSQVEELISWLRSQPGELHSLIWSSEAY